jgi:ATP adenylyltransferase/5',5'''-P-1,P-4-tetraphosphate phosphorylase II
LLVKNLEQLDLLKTIGPMTILKNVACPEVGPEIRPGTL